MQESTLLSQPKQPTLKGPVFEPGPGWGFKVKKWLGKYFLKIVLPIIVVVAALTIILPKLNSGHKQETESPEVITQIVQIGDSRTKIARRALAEYLEAYPDDSLIPAQKVFIENKLQSKLDKHPVAGTTVNFSLQDIQLVIAQAKTLSPTQLTKWADYAKLVRF